MACKLPVSLRVVLCAALFILCSTPGSAQDTDTVSQSLSRRVWQEGLSLITSARNDTIRSVRSEEAYEQYAGKIIRHIDIEQVGFDFSIYQGSKDSVSSIVGLANKVHQDTRDKIIRKHMFIHPNEPLNPEKVGDNERYIRNRDFILDCRILVHETSSADSVDLTVVTRDVFALGGSVGGSLSAPEAAIYHSNVDGRGQEIRLDLLLDSDRSPVLGYGISYRKSSIFGSLADLEVGYSQLNDGASIGREKEYAFFTRMERQLVSPYTRLAGGLEVSHNWSVNTREKPDSVFDSYRYNLADFWAGYNMGLKGGFKNLNRHFAAFRVVDVFYDERPQTESLENRLRSDNINGYLFEYTFYRQQYYKTRYVIAFGRTEDLPYGFSMAVSGGYARLLRVERPYGALKFRYTRPSKSGNFYELNVQGSSFWRNGVSEDGVLTASAAYFTRAWNVGRHKLRNLANVSYTQLYNTFANDYLRINRDFVSGISTDSVFADRRLTLGLQSYLFTTWSLLGFRMGPFLAIESAFVNCVSCPSDVNNFWALSAGLRTRNENLIFGTLEFRFTYVPQNEFGEPEFAFRFRQRFRLRDRSFIRAPSLIRYNQSPE